LDGDVWPTVESLMDAAGGEAFFDATGALVLRDVPVKTAPVATLGVGSHGVVTGYESEKRWAYNKVAIVYDDGTSRRVGAWEDTDPLSATRVTGPYGRHTRLDRISVDAGKLPTLAAANAAAVAVGRRAAAPYRLVTFDAVPAPWLEPGDTVAVGFLDGTPEHHLGTSTSWPLSQLDAMTMRTTDDAYTLGT
jgi:hypothetical protein